MVVTQALNPESWMNSRETRSSEVSLSPSLGGNSAAGQAYVGCSFAAAALIARSLLPTISSIPFCADGTCCHTLPPLTVFEVSMEPLLGLIA